MTAFPDAFAEGYIVRMHVLFTHQNFPAQFGQIANYLVHNHGWRCTFASRHGGDVPGIERVRYEPESGARQETNFL